MGLLKGAAPLLPATGAAYSRVAECHLPLPANSALILLAPPLDAGNPRRESHDPGLVEAVKLIAAGVCE